MISRCQAGKETRSLTFLNSLLAAPTPETRPSVVHFASMGALESRGTNFWFSVGGWVALAALLGVIVRTMRKATPSGQYVPSEHFFRMFTADSNLFDASLVLNLSKNSGKSGTDVANASRCTQTFLACLARSSYTPRTTKPWSLRTVPLPPSSKSSLACPSNFTMYELS